jgi:hypothetical protein
VRDNWAALGPGRSQASGEWPHSAQEFIVGKRLQRTGGHVNHAVPLRCFDDLRQLGIVSTGINTHRVPAARKCGGQLCNVQTLRRFIGAPSDEWTRLRRNHRNVRGRLRSGKGHTFVLPNTPVTQNVRVSGVRNLDSQVFAFGITNWSRRFSAPARGVFRASCKAARSFPTTSPSPTPSSNDGLSAIRFPMKRRPPNRQMTCRWKRHLLTGRNSWNRSTWIRIMTRSTGHDGA